eukprot:GHUV01039710.1.p1 GENE.GHUV01039710.1~~GHUV01039710.1.p1  ORF type:complete len:113 (+),score=16.66 GHUV01039710.1:369-707(+)
MIATNPVRNITIMKELKIENQWICRRSQQSHATAFALQICSKKHMDGSRPHPDHNGPRITMDLCRCDRHTLASNDLCSTAFMSAALATCSSDYDGHEPGKQQQVTKIKSRFG